MTQISTPKQTHDLIERAKSHELGLEFLINGSLDAVAVTFGVHAFVVDEARDHLASPGVTTQRTSVPA